MLVLVTCKVDKTQSKLSFKIKKLTNTTIFSPIYKKMGDFGCHRNEFKINLPQNLLFHQHWSFEIY